MGDGRVSGARNPGLQDPGLLGVGSEKTYKLALCYYSINLQRKETSVELSTMFANGPSLEEIFECPLAIVEEGSFDKPFFRAWGALNWLFSVA